MLKDKTFLLSFAVLLAILVGLIGVYYMLFLDKECCACNTAGEFLENNCCPCPNLKMTTLIEKEFDIRVTGVGMQHHYCNMYNDKYNTSIRCFE